MNWFTKGWWKFWQVDTEPKTLEILRKHEHLISKYTEIDVKESKGIGEPVIAIVKSFKEKGRWKITEQQDPFARWSYDSKYVFTVEDSVTGERYKMCSNGYTCLGSGRYAYRIRFPKAMSTWYLPFWMTEAEKKYVCESFEVISNRVAERIQLVEDRYRTKDNKQAKVNQDKERQRLISLYCKE
jgi:hypothetical protein